MSPLIIAAFIVALVAVVYSIGSYRAVVRAALRAETAAKRAAAIDAKLREAGSEFPRCGRLVAKFGIYRARCPMAYGHAGVCGLTTEQITMTGYTQRPF